MLDQDVRAFAQVSCRVLLDHLVEECVEKVDVVYLHGLSTGMIRSCNLLQLVEDASMWCPYVAYNGDLAEHAQTIGWSGAESYREEFISRGIDEEQLLPTAPGIHTRSECDEFVALAKLHSFRTASIVSVPYHWPRIIACLVGSMSKHDYRLKVYFQTPEAINWNEVMVGSQGTKRDSTFLSEAADDMERFCTYLERGREDGGEAWKTRYGAPLEEIMMYLDWRDSDAE